MRVGSKKMSTSLWLMQDLIEQFFKSRAASSFRKPWHQLTALPDAYNYKVREEGGGSCACCLSDCPWLQRFVSMFLPST